LAELQLFQSYRNLYFNRDRQDKKTRFIPQAREHEGNEENTCSQ
jgi:hypothetical protein